MGIIKATTGSVGGNLADQWLETIEPEKINNTILACKGIKVRKDSKRSSNKKGTEDVISNGSIIHVPENVYMLLTDGGKIIAATDEAGYYQVDNTRAPSIMFRSQEGTTIEGYNNTEMGAIERPGGLANTLKDSWERFKFGGGTPVKQKVIYINKQEIPDIKFGTKNPVPYSDRVLIPGRLLPCKLTSFGVYSIKIEDPLLFYSQVCGKSGEKVFSVRDIAQQYLSEFLMAYTTGLAGLSAENVCVSDIAMKTSDLGRHMAKVLDEEWLAKRGFLIYSVGISSISYDDKTEKLLEQYGSDSLLFDPNARAARMTAGMAAGLEAAGGNEGGAMMGFAGMNMAAGAATNLGVMPSQQQQQNYSQPAPPVPPTVDTTRSQNTYTCSCGKSLEESDKFCPVCGSKKVETKKHMCQCGNVLAEGDLFCPKCGTKQIKSDEWTCSCGNTTKDLFCSKCGTKKPSEVPKYKCSKCEWEPEDMSAPPAFCPKCGDRFNEEDRI